MLAFVIAFIPMTFNFPTKVEAATTLTVYPAPAGVPLNADYTVKVRETGGVWQDLDEYRNTVGYPTKTNASFVYFDTDGQVEMSVTYNIGTITSSRIRGLNTEITPNINGNTMTFSISGPMKLSVEVNGNVNKHLMIFANPLEVNPPSPSDPNVIYLGPGLYQQDYTVPSGKTLYIAGGAVVQGGIILDNATNAKVIGRGVLDRPAGRAISIDYSNQITVDGIIVSNYGSADGGGCAINAGNSSNVLINNFKAYGSNKWGDGIDTFASTNITINDSFIRSHDDSVAIYNARANGGRIWYGDTKNITVTNSILMPDFARPINMGTHGFTWAPGGGQTIENVTFSNLDLWIYNGGQRIQFISADGNLIQNVNFNDIRIDDTREGRFLVMQTKSWDYGPGRGINNVHFKNLSYTGSGTGGNPIEGYDSTRKIQNITFENLKMNGTVITNAAQGNFTTNGNTSNINFIASGDPVPEAIPQFPSPAPINLALNRSASASSSQSGHPASSGNDGSTTTRWTANDGNTGHWWTVDLGASKDITRGTQVMWEQIGKAYKYKIETSNDNVNWTLKVDKTDNTSTDQIQNDVFVGTARYVRITVTGLPSGNWASFYDFKVLGETVNLAENKAASSDSTLTGIPVSRAVDGNSITRWIAADGAAGHWVKVDLGYIKNITYGTQVSFEKSGVAYQYKIETSKDNTNWTLKVDKTNNTNTEKVQTDYFTDNARYVRITVTGLPSGTSASFYDLKVFGDPVNLALGKTVSSDSSQSTNPASNGNDGIMTTRWSANDGNTGHWWTVDLGSSKWITGTQVMWEKLDSYYRYKIETSNDNVNWTTKVDKTWYGNTAQVQSDYFVATAQYVRITVAGVPSGATASFYDFKVFGTFNGPTVYEDIQYGGKAVTLDLGNYTLAQMQAAGIANDNISSIQVPAEYKVVAYSDDGFSGTSWTITSDNPSMIASGNNDMISSIKVMSAGPTFYEHYNYVGNAVTLHPGQYTLAQMQAAGIADNSISSIRVPAGFTVVAYSDDGFSGTSWTITSDNPAMGDTGNNDIISSIIITSNQ
ncbi:discoidin domain-containing protein [Paenibacillus sp. V4I9]|uniref:discoidin domain-containing protein n=1 Tax=Paenibacillus sp. V4I9 TaxID=3042308 RepID=UPI0027D900BB|nr:discoidin domain-containing protein [Paenibacillus sp. V4I9]